MVIATELNSTLPPFVFEAIIGDLLSKNSLFTQKLFQN